MLYKEETIDYFNYPLTLKYYSSYDSYTGQDKYCCVVEWFPLIDDVDSTVIADRELYFQSEQIAKEMALSYFESQIKYLAAGNKVTRLENELLKAQKIQSNCLELLKKM